VVGSPIWEQIVQSAERLDAGLIVIGSHGRTGLGQVMLGSVAAAVAQHSKRSVLIVHRPQQQRSEPGAERRPGEVGPVTPVHGFCFS
jgi:K+-sensing histidine kinase KdpD